MDFDPYINLLLVLHFQTHHPLSAYPVGNFVFLKLSIGISGLIVSYFNIKYRPFCWFFLLTLSNNYILLPKFSNKIKPLLTRHKSRWTNV